MIVKRNLSLLHVLRTDRAPLAYAIGVAVVVTAAHELLDVSHLAVPFAPVGTLGAAVAIFTAFRISAGNTRWTEARVQWATIQNSCRVLTRQLTASTAFRSAAGRSPMFAVRPLKFDELGVEVGVCFGVEWEDAAEPARNPPVAVR
jgi:predicted membrane chloride channel (bestrophin family)